MAKVIFTETHEELALHYMLLVRQIARLSDCLLHIIRLHTRGDEDGKLFRIFRVYAQSEIGDIICHCKKLCEVLNIPYDETEKMGDFRDKEKQKDFNKRYPNEYWI